MLELDLSSLAGKVSALKPRTYRTFVSKLYDLVEQIRWSMMLRGPYRLVVDSNIVMRLESLRKGNITEGVLSVLVALLYLKCLNEHVDIVIRPVVFYEYLRKRNVRDLKSHWEDLKLLKSLVEDSLHVTLFFDGTETYEGATALLAEIEQDASAISKMLRSYRETNWKFDFVRPWRMGEFDGFPLDGGNILVPPWFAAQGLYKPVSLKHFVEPIARLFFLSHIEKHLSDCPTNDRGIFEHHPSEDAYLFSRILRLTAKGNLEGLGDVDVFTQCNLRTQFQHQSHGRYVPASIGLTLDENLTKALVAFRELSISSRKLGGSDEPSVQSQHAAALESFFEDHKRFGEGEKRLSYASELLTNFVEELWSRGIFRNESAGV